MALYLDQAMFGIRFDVSGSELRDHCAARMKYHEGRKEFYTAEEARFKDEVDELAKQDIPKYSNSVTSSNKGRMEMSKNHHADRARFFRFSSAHLLKDHYMLRLSDLQMFEMVPV